MSETTRSINHAPRYSFHRSAISSADALPETDKARGVNANGYLGAHVQVLPSGGANPSVAVLVWSEEAGRFIELDPAVAKTGHGADVPYEFTFEVRSRIFFVAVTAIAAGAVDVLVAGSELDHLR